MNAQSSRLFDRLKQGLEDGIADERGERKLRVTEIVVPDPPGNISPQKMCGDFVLS